MYQYSIVIIIDESELVINIYFATFMYLYYVMSIYNFSIYILIFAMRMYKHNFVQDTLKAGRKVKPLGAYLVLHLHLPVAPETSLPHG